MAQKFLMENYGCQMNRSDTGEVRERFKRVGFEEGKIEGGKVEEGLDVVVINSCAIRAGAEERIYRRLRYYGGLKKERDFVLVLMGCVAQKEKEKVMEEVKEVDFVIGTHEKKNLVDIVMNYLRGEGSKGGYYDFVGYNFDDGVISRGSWFRSEFTIIHGCNRGCSYCIVPRTRGREVSRRSEEIIGNIERLVGMGVKEVCLLGQNVNAYGKDSGDVSFAKLLRKTSGVRGLERVRFLTSHPMDFEDELIEVIGGEESVCPYVHIPLQSGSDRVLKLMRREYTYGEYERIIEKLKEKVEGLVLSTDIIVGFPGEEEYDFEMTLEAMRGVRYDHAYMFKYSERKGTESADRYEDSVEESEKKRRLSTLIEEQGRITKERNASWIGHEVEVLLERRSRNREEELLGKTRGNQGVVVLGGIDEVGLTKRVRLSGLRGNTFVGVEV